jgi:hypothetical protein
MYCRTLILLVTRKSNFNLKTKTYIRQTGVGFQCSIPITQFFDFSCTLKLDPEFNRKGASSRFQSQVSTMGIKG